MGDENRGLDESIERLNSIKLDYDVGVQFPDVKNVKIGNTTDSCLQTEHSYFDKTISNTPHKIYLNPVVFTIKVHVLYLTKNGMKRMRSMMNQQQNRIFLIFPFMECPVETPKVDINNECIFNFEHNFFVNSINQFYQAIQNTVELRFYLWNNKTHAKFLLAKGSFNLSDIFVYPHNEIHQNVEIKSANNQRKVEYLFGSLSLCYQINADFDTLELIIKHWSDIKNVEPTCTGPGIANTTEETSKYSLISTPQNYKYVPVTSSIETGMVASVDGVKRSISDYDLKDRQKVQTPNDVDPVKEVTPSLDTVTPKINLKVIKSKCVNNVDKTSSTSDCSFHTFSNSRKSPESPEPLSTEILGKLSMHRELLIYPSRHTTTFNISELVEVGEEAEQMNKHSPSTHSSRLAKVSIRSLDVVSNDEDEHKYQEVTPSNNSDRKSMLKIQKPKALGKVFSIIIHTLTLYVESPVMRDINIKQLYIEYSFLNFEGEDMETPASLPKPNRFEMKPLVFEFERKFRFDKTMAKILREKLLKRDTIKFLLISEPLADASELSDCEEIGYVEIGYYDLVNTLVDIEHQEFVVKYMKNHDIDIGSLTLSFIGIKIIRNIILKQP